MTSTETARKTRTIQKGGAPHRPCPHCRESIPITSETCIFCDRPTNFLQTETSRRQKASESIKAIRRQQEAYANKGSVTTGVIVGLFALLILATSVAGLVLAPKEVTVGMGGLGALMGVVGLVFAVHNVFGAARKR